jgi:hypothetical protein
MPPDDRFLVARNPDPESRLPYLVRLPLEGGVVLKSRERWPRDNRVFCSEEPVDWGAELDIVDEAVVLLCRRRGASVDLVLDRPRDARSQFVFTIARGRPAVWWQTQHSVQNANPGARVPRGRAAGVMTIIVDTRERYGWGFKTHPVSTRRLALTAGDYAVLSGAKIAAVVERKALANLATSLSDGSLSFQMQKLAGEPLAAVVVEGTYPELFRTQPGRGAWLADMLARLAVRYPEVPIVFTGSRKFAEDWTYRFFGAAVGDTAETDLSSRYAPVQRSELKVAEAEPGDTTA